jgi:hypothetical protein
MKRSLEFLMILMAAILSPACAHAQWVTGTITATALAPVGSTYSTSDSQSQVVTSLYFNSRFGWINNLGTRACLDFISGNNTTAPASSGNTKEVCLNDGQYILLTSNVPVAQAAYLRMATGSSTNGTAFFVTW